MPAQRPRSALSNQEDSDSPVAYSDSGSIGGSQILSPNSAASGTGASTTPLPVPQSAPPTHSPSFSPFHQSADVGRSIDDDYDSDESEGNYDKIDIMPIDREQPMPLPKATPTNQQHPRPPSADDVTTSSTPFSSSKDRSKTLPSMPGGRGRKGSEALSAAVSDLIKRCIFVGGVTRDYHWPRTDQSTTSASSEEFFVKVCTYDLFLAISAQLPF